MNIYKVSRTDDTGYDEFDSFVCFAESEENARNIMPDFADDIQWVEDKKGLKITLLGHNDSEDEEKSILASYNAG